jgi:hypothetical protein
MLVLLHLFTSCELHTIKTVWKHNIVAHFEVLTIRSLQCSEVNHDMLDLGTPVASNEAGVLTISLQGYSQ